MAKVFSKFLYSLPTDLSVARFNFHGSYLSGFVAYLLPCRNKEGAILPLIFEDHSAAFRLFIIAIIFTFVAAYPAVVIGDNSTLARSCTLCSVITMVLALSVLAYVFLPNFFRCFLLFSSM